MEWTTQTREIQAETYGNGHDAQPPDGNGHETQPLPTPPTHLPEESVAPPVTSAPPPVPAHHAAPAPSATPQAPSGYEQCPSCGALVAVDQRYCLECGHRRGEPRLPFMDAVVFMDAMNRPPEAASAPAKSKKRGISPNAALIAGVGTLLLALGVGVMIGRSGDQSSAPASQAPIVIKGGAGEEETKNASAAGTTIGGGKGGKATKTTVKAKKKEAESGKGAEEVLKPVAGVTMPPATAKVGEKCDKKVAGCSKSGEFDGSFFGEE